MKRKYHGPLGPVCDTCQAWKQYEWHKAYSNEWKKRKRRRGVPSGETT